MRDSRPYSAPTEGTVLDNKYRLIRLLGRGGMGSVFLGEHIVIGRKVAIKLLKPECVADPESVARFYLEAKAAAAVGHRSIIDIYDTGVAPDGAPYLVMEYLQGESLASVLRCMGSLPLSAVCAIMDPILHALHAVHEKEIVHRDLKPDNIFLVRNPGERLTVKLIDFGISKFVANADITKLTQSGVMLGSPIYMAPEQITGASPIDRRTDIWSVGVMLYEMLTGKMPFGGATYNTLMMSILSGDPEPPCKVCQIGCFAIDDIFLKAVAKNPAERWQTALEMLEALSELPEFEARDVALDKLGARISGIQAAVGTLDQQGYAGVSALAAEDASRERPHSEDPTTANSKAVVQRRSMFWAFVLTLAITLAVGSLTFWFGGKDSESASAPVGSSQANPVKQRPQPVAQATPSTQSRHPELRQAVPTVSIEVKGAPRDALIKLDGAAVKENPFRVRREDVSMLLEIEATGFEPHKERVSANADQIVSVSLFPEQKAQPREHAAPAVKRPKDRPPSPEQPKKKIKETGRGINVAEDFE